MQTIDTTYISLVEEVLKNGVMQNNRTGTKALVVPSSTAIIDVSVDTFPILTTKYVNFKAILDELIWFISGSTNTNDLESSIWNDWADEEGNLGPIYGHQWSRQLPQVIDEIKNNPTSRRLIVDSWQIADLAAMRLPPCHFNYIFSVIGGTLYLTVTQRSCDCFLGIPFNWSSYSLLLIMVANITNLDIGYLTYNMVNVHIYENHMEQIYKQLQQEEWMYPSLVLPQNAKELTDFTMENVYLDGYFHGPKIKGAVAV